MRELVDTIGNRTVFIYGAGPRARLLSMTLAAGYDIIPSALVVTEKSYEDIDSVSLDRETSLPVISFNELCENGVINGRCIIINTVSDAVAYGIISAIDRLIADHPGARHVDLTDGAHDHIQYECMAQLLRSLGTDIESDVLTFDGMEMSNPLNSGMGVTTLFPAVGNIILPLIYSDERLASTDPYECEEVMLRSGETVIDAGANIGAFACCAAHKGCQVFAFEPNVDVFPLLEKQSDLYRSSSDKGDIIPLMIGLSDRNGTITFHLTDNPQAAAFDVTWGGEKHYRAVESRIMPLDDLVKENKITCVDFIKLAINGSECAFFRGAAETISHFKPKLSIMMTDIIDKNAPGELISLIRHACGDYKIKIGKHKVYAWV